MEEREYSAYCPVEGAAAVLVRGGCEDMGRL